MRNVSSILWMSGGEPTEALPGHERTEYVRPEQLPSDSRCLFGEVRDGIDRRQQVDRRKTAGGASSPFFFSSRPSRVVRGGKCT